MTFIPMNGSSEDMKLNDDGVFIAIKTAEKLNAGVEIQSNLRRQTIRSFRQKLLVFLISMLIIRFM